MVDTPTMSRPAPAPAPIDPRIRARRIEVQRDAGRRRLARLVDVGLVAAVAALFGAALWTPLLDVDGVRVTGTSRLDAAEVAAQAGVAVGDPLVRVDVGAVGDRVAALPWVAEVRVTRGIAGLVELEVTERTPVAVVGEGDAAMLVDREGRVLAPAGADHALPELTGVGPAPEPGAFVDAASADALALAARLDDTAPGALSTLEIGDLVATLRQGGQVRFGDASHLDAKLRSLGTVLEQVDLTCLALIDLRLPQNAVLTREEGCS